jgi:hypothetical protein
MPTEENKNIAKKDKIRRLKESLYEKGFKNKPIEPGEFEKQEYEVSEKWAEPSVEEKNNKQKLRLVKRSLMLKSIFIVSTIFFFVALGFFVYKFYYGGNVISAENIKISINGPVSVNGGEEFDLEVVIDNKSGVIVESPELLIEYPEGAYQSFESQKKLVRTMETLNPIKPNEIVTRKFPLVLFGEENSEKEITASLDFRFEGSSATLEKKENYTIKLASSPIDLSLDVPKEINSKQEFELTIRVKSNSNETIKGLLLSVDYPFGFLFKNAAPVPTSLSVNNIWKIGDIKPLDERVIKIRGVMEGKEGDEKFFNVHTGIISTENDNSIGTIYNSVSESISITKPSLGVDLLVNGSSLAKYVSGSKETVRVDILWKNNIPTKITDNQIEVKLKGEALNKFSVLAGSGGFYRSVDNTIVWNKINNKKLSSIEPGGEGSVNFTFKSLPLTVKDEKVFKNPTISMDVSVKGRRISDIGGDEAVSTSFSRDVKLESDLSIAARAVYNIGPFKNTGPIPPKAEKETTYTVIWTVTNSSNTISSAVAKTVLPPYVKWLGVVSPNNEDISFNEVGGEVVWNIGKVDPGAGFIIGARKVAFQISLLPSVSQIGRAPFLTGPITLSGKDTFTGTILQDTETKLSTRLSTDPYFNLTQSVVTY